MVSESNPVDSDLVKEENQGIDTHIKINIIRSVMEKTK